MALGGGQKKEEIEQNKQKGHGGGHFNAGKDVELATAALVFQKYHLRPVRSLISLFKLSPTLYKAVALVRYLSRGRGKEELSDVKLTMDRYVSALAVQSAPIMQGNYLYRKSI